MEQRTIHLFTEKEEELVNLFIKIGMKKVIAQILVYIARTEEATARDIERGIDLRQSECSMAVRYLTDQGWLKSRKIPSERKGRDVQMYRLTVPLSKILNGIEKQKKTEANNQLAIIKKMRSFL